MGYTEDMETSRNNCAARLAEITASPKPSYDVNGQKIYWSEYCRMLTEQIASLNKLIAVGDGTPVEVVTQGYT